MDKSVSQIATTQSFPVTIVFERRASRHPWAEMIWLLSGVLPGRSSIDEQGARSFHEQETGRIETFTWNMTLFLHKAECAAYYDNLISDQPKVFVGSSLQDDGVLRPYHISLDLSEAEAWMVAEEIVHSTALDPELYVRLEHFVVTHYQPIAPRKRQRKP